MLAVSFTINLGNLRIFLIVCAFWAVLDNGHATGVAASCIRNFEVLSNVALTSELELIDFRSLI